MAKKSKFEFGDKVLVKTKLSSRPQLRRLLGFTPDGRVITDSVGELESTNPKIFIDTRKDMALNPMGIHIWDATIKDITLYKEPKKNKSLEKAPFDSFKEVFETHPDCKIYFMGMLVYQENHEFIIVNTGESINDTCTTREICMLEFYQKAKGWKSIKDKKK